MHADVNILHAEVNSTVLTEQGINNGYKRRGDVCEETDTFAKEAITETEERSLANQDEHNETDVDSNEKDYTTKNPSKVLKTQLECGSWRCTNLLCNAEDNNDMLVCSNCKSKFCCTDLPAYQIAQFVLVKSYRKFLCVSCVKIPEDLLLKCTHQNELESANILADRSNTLRMLQDDYDSKCEVIESLETAINTLQALIIDKDIIIQSQCEVIVSLKKSNIAAMDDVNIKCKCSEVRDSDLIALREQYESTCKDITNVHVGNDYLQKRVADKDKQHEDLKKNCESVIMQKTVLEKRIDDLSMISGMVDLALSAKDKLLHAKEEIIDNLKTIVALRKDNQQEGGNPPVIKLSKPGVKECCEFIEIHTSSSAVLNGLLLWADVQRQTTPENVWKAHHAGKRTVMESVWRCSFRKNGLPSGND